jgi:hypothetical protein
MAKTARGWLLEIATAVENWQPRSAWTLLRVQHASDPR